MKFLARLLLAIVNCFLLQIIVVQAEPADDEMEKWFLSDELTPPSQSSDSQLTFIPPPGDKPALHSINVINITPQSIETGWVSLEQCYRQLDAVPDMEVSYQYKAMRKLKIVATKNIEQAHVQGQSVQLSNVNKGAQLCVSAEVRIFYKNKDGSYQLVNGPFHRQFLDSFFPYHLSMKVTYPASSLQFISVQPENQLGFELEQNENILQIDTHFTGKLYTVITFKPLPE